MKSSVTSSLLLSSLLFFSSANAIRLPFERRAPRGASMSSPRSPSRYSLSFLKAFGGLGHDKEVIGNVNDVRYTVNITINGRDATVVLDTGSTDLWVFDPDMGTVNDTQIPLSLLYGDGTYGVEGTIAVSPFEFGQYKVEKQAFLNVNKSTGIDGLYAMGLNGVFGLAFENSAASPINKKIKGLYGDNATWGASVIKNIFDQDPTLPNLISIQLSRTGDLEGTGGGEILIGEVNADWADKSDNATKLERYPKDGSRWTTLVDGFYVDGQQVPINYTSVVPLGPGISPNATVALLDTGDPDGTVPFAVADAIFSRIPGAVHYVEDGEQFYFVPCNTTTNLEVSIGGTRYGFHPLDLSHITQPFNIGDGQDHIACISSFNIVDGFGRGEFDMVLGTTFLRNVYSVYDFGDPLPTGDLDTPYMKLVSTLDPAKAIQQVSTIRGQTLADLPPEIPPSKLVAFLTAGGTPSDPLPSPTSTGLASSNDLEKGGLFGDFSSAANAANAFSQYWPEIKKWGIFAVALLALNALIGLVLLIMGCMMCIRKGGRSRTNGVPAVTTMGTGYTPSSGPAVSNASNQQYAPLKQDEAFGGGYPQHHQQALPRYAPQ